MKRTVGLLLTILVLLALAGCGDMSDEAYATLETQREDVLSWGRELSKTASAVLESEPEIANESYDGVEHSGVTYDFVSFRYQLQANFDTTHADPLGALAEEFSAYDAIVVGDTLKLTKGDFVAYFSLPLNAKSPVAFEAVGPTIKIKQEDLRDRGWIIGESVDLG